MKHAILHRIVIGAISLMPCLSMANSASYISVGNIESEFAGSEYDRLYESNINTIQQFKFHYENKQYLDMFGAVNFDDDNEIRDFALGIALEGKLIHVETGDISGTIVDDFDKNQIGEFDNKYIRIGVFDDAGVDGFSMGWAVQQYSQPHLFQYNDGSSFGPHIQDEALKFSAVGFGFYYDSILNTMREDFTGAKMDWYFSTSTLGISLAYAETSDSPEMMQYGMDGQSFLLWGNSGDYELGLLWAYKSDYASVVANIGYHLRANTWLNVDPTALFADDAPLGEVNLDSSQLILHGVAASIAVSF